MPVAWRTVRVFVSSTFRDMHAERDHLVRFIFPELRERCARRRLHLLDVDLRWGVTEEEAHTGKVLEICLAEIDRCRPYFLCLLGERYGWVPPRYELPDEPRWNSVRSLPPGQLVTALEVLFGAFDAAKAHAFFYLRDAGFLADLPDQVRPDYDAENAEVRGPPRRAQGADPRWPVRSAPLRLPLGRGEASGNRGLRALVREPPLVRD